MCWHSSRASRSPAHSEILLFERTSLSGETYKSRLKKGLVARTLPILHSARPSPAKPKPNHATYQTNLNHSQYSKCIPLRLTLSMLWFLRVPPMVRTAFIAFSLAVFVATSAGAARINTLRTPAHATITKSTVHRTHSPSRSRIFNDSNAQVRHCGSNAEFPHRFSSRQASGIQLEPSRHILCFVL